MLEALSDLKKPFKLVWAFDEQLDETLDDAERYEILEWISIIPYVEHHRQLYNKIMAGTCEWLLRSKEVLEWQSSSSSSIMWLNGDPGSGKSCLVYVTSFLIPSKCALKSAGLNWFKD